MKTKPTHRPQATMRQATMRETPNRRPAVGLWPGLRHVDLGLAIAATLMAVVSLALNDVAKAPLYALLAYLLWRLPGCRRRRPEPEQARFSTEAAEPHEDERSSGG